MRNMTFEL